MKKSVYMVLLCIILVFCGCSWQLPDENDPSYKYLYRETSVSSDSAVRVPVTDQDITEQTYSDEVYSDEPYFSETESISEVEINSEAPGVDSTTREPDTTREEEESATQVSLDISMPQKNGSMYTDSSADNKFIKIVNEKKGISKDLLVAVFAVPDSGQNYVFEFYDNTGRTADNLRRVYLIDSAGNIVSVSAVDSSERVGIGTIENWFSMNVLIKEVIFPAISDSIE